MAGVWSLRCYYPLVIPPRSRMLSSIGGRLASSSALTILSSAPKSCSDGRGKRGHKRERGVDGDERPPKGSSLSRWFSRLHTSSNTQVSNTRNRHDATKGGRKKQGNRVSFNYAGPFCMDPSTTDARGSKQKQVESVLPHYSCM